MSSAKSASAKHQHAHHFDSAEHEYVSSKQGVWLFLCTEILMFGGLFVAYIIFHGLYPEMFLAGAKGTDWRLGALNTVVLLTSSLTMALAIHYVQVGKSAKANTMLWTTIACGLVFMVVKYFEYSHKIHLGNLPGAWFSGDTKGFENMGMYYSFYFMMTGIHGAHVLVGLGLIAWVAIRNSRGEFSPEHYTAVEGVGLFWHLVDLVWIFLFPLLYLVE